MPKTRTRYEIWRLGDMKDDDVFVRDTYWIEVADHWLSMLVNATNENYEIREVEETWP